MPDNNTFGRTDTLPPIGDLQPGSSDEGKVVELIYARRQGVINALSLPLQLAKKCRKYATWGEDTEVPDETTTIAHKIKQAIETQVANHLKEPVQVTIEPVESGEYAKWYWCGPVEAIGDLAQFGIGIDPLCVGGTLPDGRTIPPEPLPVQIVAAIKQISGTQPDIISPDYICKLDDQYIADTLQRKLDADWKDAKVDKWLRSRVYANIVEGWQLPFIEWDATRGYILNHNSIFQTYIDQSAEDVDDAAEAGIDIYMDLNEALARYPDQRAAILADNVVSSGSLQPPQTQGQVPTQYIGQFRRPMVRKVVWWVRNQPVGVQEAVNAGLVIQSGGASGQNALAAGGLQAAPEENGELDSQAVPGAQVDGGMELAGATPLVYTLPNGQPVTPDSPDWPSALAQISIINNAVVEYVICPWPDIPICQMRNSLVIGKPWGVGEPFYIKKIQDGMTTIVDASVRHSDYNSNAAVEMHQSLKNSMEAEYGRAFVDPGKIIGVPGDLWKDGNPLVRIIEPPPFPDSNFKILQTLTEMFNEISGRPDVLAGNTPTKNASGELVAQLQSAAAEPMNFRAQEIGFCVEKLANLMLHAILHFQKVEEISEELSMPLPLLQLVMQRAAARPPNVQVTISTGSGSVLERKRQQYLQWNSLVSPDDGLPLADGETTRNLLGIDAAKSVRNSQRAKREAMAAQMAMMPPPQPAQRVPVQGGNGQNGNGRFGDNHG